MDSYTDVSGQCCRCGCRHVSCNTPGQNDCSPDWQTDYPDMNMPPWTAGDFNAPPFYPFGGNAYPNMNKTECVSTAPGCLEKQFPVAMAYVPWQQWTTTYAPERGLVQGTIFPEMDLQFNYGRCGR